MQIPADFYYELEQEQPHYVNYNTGNLSVERIISSTSYWIAPSSKVCVKRKLIISDWTSSSWSNSYRELVEAGLSELENLGFKLYIEHKGTIRPLVNFAKTFSLLRNPTNPESRETIIREAMPEASCGTGLV